MPIRPPRLDDRSYQDLLAELIARIPAHTPEWTDPRPGDPGRTLLELFAWLGDTLLYRVNLMPERQRLEFLRMVGLPLRPARPASGLVSVRLKEGLVIPTLLPGAKISGPPDFETLRPLSILPVTGVCYHKRVPNAAELKAVSSMLPQLSRFYQLGNAHARPYVTTPTFGEGAIDLHAASVDGNLWIALLAAKAEQVTTIRELIGKGRDGIRTVLTVGVVPVMQADAGGDPLTGGVATRPLSVAWEITTGRRNSKGPEYIALDVNYDTTAGLTRTGVVELNMPETRFIGAPANDVREDPDAGVGPRPPRLDDPRMVGRLVTWLRLRPTISVDHLRLAWVGINAAEVDQRRTVADLTLGFADGSPDQSFALPLGSVERASFVLQVEEEGVGWVTWTAVEHLALARPDDRVFALDDQEGLVLFGDGQRGKLPEAGRRVRVLRMRAGGGEEGNLPALTLKTLSARTLDSKPFTLPVEVTQPMPTVGGAAAETVAEAERRIPAVLRHRDRAVTADDLAELASTTPGVRLGRVEIMPGFKPQQRTTGVPGVVSVMVLPQLGAALPPNPRPSRHTIEAVYDHLSPRVTLGTELYVIGCEYIPLALSVSFELRPGFGRDETIALIQSELRRFLWPLVGGGPFDSMGGWPIKRPVRARELEVVVARVPGVDEVRGVKLFSREGEGAWKKVLHRADGSVEVDLKLWQLPELLKVVVVTEGEAPDTVEGSDGRHSNEVAIPVVPELC